MSLPEQVVPHMTGLDFGIGVDAGSLAARNLAIEGEATLPDHAPGVAEQGFKVSELSSSHDLEKQLSIDVSASYGAPFAANVSARFGFAEDVKVHSSSLFIAIRATIKLASLSIRAPKLTDEASKLAEHTDIFIARYGNMFVHGCDRGGLFVGVLQIDTEDEEQSKSISADLSGSYGLFHGEAAVKFSSVESRHGVHVYCSMYAEGGPVIDARHPDDPGAMLTFANTWLQAMHDDPDHNATPYNWHLSPITIASGPIPPNEAEIAHAQEVVQFCSSERLARLDDLNQLSYAVLYPQRFDWTFASKEDVVAASRAAQDDLDLIAACASNAMNNTKDALMPAGFAEAQGKTYPSMTAMPDPMPSVKLGERAAYEARGASIAAAEEIAGAMREAEPAGMARRGFDYGLGWSELSTSWGPGARKVEQELEPEARASFHRATEYSIVRNVNAAALERGSGVIKADPAVAAARAAHQPAGLHWLGFTIATGLYGDKALGADGSNPPRGPGGERIRDTFTAVDGKNGFDDGQNFNWAHRGVG